MNLSCLSILSNWALVLLTLALVLITAYYAWTNRKMYLEMAEGRRKALRPLISISTSYEEPEEDEELLEPGNPLLFFKNLAIKVSNVGNAPALNLTLSAELFLEKESFQGKEVLNGTLGLNYLVGIPITKFVPDVERKVGAKMFQADENGKPKAQHMNLRVIATYLNSYSVKFNDIATFAADQHNYKTEWHLVSQESKEVDQGNS